MTYVHPYDLFDCIINGCEAVALTDGAARYPILLDLVSIEDEHFIYDMCEQIADGLAARHPEWKRRSA